MNFTTKGLKAPEPKTQEHAIIFGLWSRTRTGPEEAVAFLRHAFKELYTAFTKVETRAEKLHIVVVIANAVDSFIGAVRREAAAIRITFANNIYSSNRYSTPIKKYKAFHFESDGRYILCDELRNEMQRIQLAKINFLRMQKQGPRPRAN